MARTVIIRPEFFKDEEVAGLDAMVQLFFTGLWTMTNRAGCINASLAEIKSSVTPFRDADCASMLEILVAHRFIAAEESNSRYEIKIPDMDKWCISPKSDGDSSHSSNRRARKLRAMPAWADRKAIRAIYVEARRRILTGEDVHVDHDIPLAGKAVSGLHVHFNLKIIPASENLRKANKFAAGK